MIHIPVLLLLLLLPFVGCAGPERSRSRQSQTADGPRPVDSTAPATDPRPLILFLGTSLTAGLGVDPDSAYPALIQRKLDSAGVPLRTVNAGVSGETSAGALRRLPALLRDSIRVLVVETGANDGLRGLDPDSTAANINALVAQARAHDPAITIVLAQMEAPPNMGPRFTARFRALFPTLARRERLVLMPFLLEGVGGVDTLNQDDGIHPTPAGHRVVAANVWRTLEPLIGERRQ